MSKILIEVDDKLTGLIDIEAKESQRSRKSQVTYIIKSYYKQELDEIKRNSENLTADSFKY